MIPKTKVCPQISEWASKEVLRLNSSLVRIVRGIDPSVAFKALEDAVANDVVKNAGNIAKAAAEGMGSEFTQKLIKAAVDEILNEVMATFPETRDILSKVKNYHDMIFSIVQIVFTMIEEGPLAVASRTKRYTKEEIAKRSDQLSRLSSKYQELVVICKDVQKNGPIFTKVMTGALEASKNLAKADSYLLNVRVKLLKKIIDIPTLSNAKDELFNAIKALSPLDADLNKNAITTNKELLEMLNLGYSDIDIKIRLLNASAINSFDFSEKALEELREAGMSKGVERVFIGIQNRKKATPNQMLIANARRIAGDIRDILDEVQKSSNRIVNLVENYLTVELYLDKPKVVDTHANDFYVRIVDSVRERILKVSNRIVAATTPRKERITSREDYITDIESWITEIASLLSVLELIKNGMYEDKKQNTNPTNKFYYKAYEDSVAAFNATGKYDDIDEITTAVGFKNGISLSYELLGLLQAVPMSSSQKDIDNLIKLIDASNITLLAYIAALKNEEKEVTKFLDIFNPEPSIPPIFDQMMQIIQLMGMDRLFDQVTDGNLECLFNISPNMASYSGAASECLKNMARSASTEVERTNLLNAAKKIDKSDRIRMLGNVQLSNRSIAALKNLQNRILEIESLMKGLINIPISGVEQLTNGPILHPCKGNS